jgi:hypothetical protein
MEARWSRGDVILWCYRREVMPVRVVRDDDSCLVTWLESGTPVLRAVPADGRPIRERPLAERFTTPKHFIVDPWHGFGILRVAYPGQAHSSVLFRQPDGAFWGWYGNLEAPFRRTAFGVHTHDHALDVWFGADGAVHLKDEDELDAAVSVGFYTVDEAAAIRLEGERVRAAMQRRDAPYDGSWLDWRADPAWTTPELPQRWAALAGEPALNLFTGRQLDAWSD